jgi:hypothetical protein
LPVRVSGLNKLIGVLSQARRVIRDVGQLPQALLGDISHINEVFRQSIGFCKDLAGTIQSFADLPSNIGTTISDAVVQDGKDFKTAGNQIARSSSNFKRNILDFGYSKKSATQKGGYGAGDVEEIRKALDSVTIDRLNAYISPNTRSAIVRDINNTRQLTRSDFEKMRDDLVGFSNKMTVLLGAGSSATNLTYGLDAIVPIKDSPTDTDWELLFALNDSVMALDSLAATGDGEPSEPQRLMDVMASFARGSGMAFQVPVSKFAVPFPYGSTLESLASQYLGDPNRFLEIAALNGLKEPYVDDVGFDLYLLINGQGSRILIDNTADLYIGQRVSIGSNGATRVYRNILDLQKDINNKLVVTLDGLPDLNRYRVCDRAFLHAYLPDTINSESLIYIPSDEEPVENGYLTKDIPGINTIDPMVVAGGVDLLLDSDRNLVITEDGDSKYAIGLANIIQGVEIGFSVPQGKLLLHKSFGLPVKVGTSSADVSPQSIVSAVRDMLSNDSSFSSIGAVTVRKQGAACSIDASVVVTGSSSPLPLSFGIR